MPWFTPDAIAFFAELEQNNDKTWFDQNRKRYEQSVKQPLLEFAAEMIPRMQELDPEITMLPKNAVFRIHRDTRFSKEKAPYKTNAGMVITRGAKHNPGAPGLYFHFDSGRMAIASGLYFIEPAQLKTVREHIANNLDEFEQLLNDQNWKSHFGEMAGMKNKILPPELKEAAAKQPLLYNKQFFYWAEHPAHEITREDLADFVIAHIKAAQPMNAFLTRPIRED
jgi:uncharacterized protein (TIGR02453 family)